MSDLKTSPERHSFHIECEMKRVEEGDKTPEQAEEMIKFYQSWRERETEKEQQPEFKIDNLEYDLRSSDYIFEKCKDEFYAQNLYAAMCNNDFVRNDVWPLLTDKRWSCSWRYAGGIIADIQEKGDYIDWYCSGITGNNTRTSGYVGEGFITDEIKNDLKKLGWVIIPYKDDDYI